MIINELYNTILQRKEAKEDGSYTAYLFEQGEDKILKKIGEECAESIIAAKNNNSDDLVNELCDLLYHSLVLVAYKDIPLADIEAELKRRAEKLGNLKNMKKVDKES